jgi:hypothetical protein
MIEDREERTEGRGELIEGRGWSMKNLKRKENKR